MKAFFFTQIDIESYFLVKSLLNKKTNYKLPLTKENWLPLLKEFEEDMVLYLNQRQYSNYNLNEDELDQKSKEVISKIAKDEKLSLYARRLGLDQNLIKKGVAYFLMIQLSSDIKNPLNKKQIYEIFYFEDSQQYQYLDLSILNLK